MSEMPTSSVAAIQPSLTGPWVCAIHGVSVTVAVQHGIGGWPIGLCFECRTDAPLPPGAGASAEMHARYTNRVMTTKIRSKLSPLVRPEDYTAPEKRKPDPLPDLSPWAALAPVEPKAKARGSH